MLARYSALAHAVLDRLEPAEERLHLSQEDVEMPTDVEAPMIRYKYGPWDDRYYPTIGALVGRGLLRYAPGQRGSVALAPTAEGKRLAVAMAASREWAQISERCMAIAEASAGMTGNAPKDLKGHRVGHVGRQRWDTDRQQRWIRDQRGVPPVYPIMPPAAPRFAEYVGVR